MDTAVILAAGLGSRLGKEVHSGPKGFISLNGETLIERSIRLLKNFGISRIILGTGHMSNYYEDISEKYSLICIKNEKYETTGSFYTLLNLADHIEQDFILLESDIFYEQKALESLLELRRRNIILVSGFTNSNDEVFVDIDSNYNLRSLSKNISSLRSAYGELVGITKLSKEALEYLKIWKNKNQEMSMSIHYEEALLSINKFVNIYVRKVENLIWAEIDNKEHYTRVKNIILPKMIRADNERD